MSGGHYDYKYQSINMLIDDIELDFRADGNYYDEWYDKTRNHLEDRDLTEEQQKELLIKIKEFIEELKIVAKKARDLEWMMSADTSPKTLYDDWIKNKK